MAASIFTSDHKLAPYWWEDAPRPALAESTLPRHVDVAIVGSGYTGLAAALVLARSSRRVIVFDAEDAGWGCSSRNGGQVSTSLKPGLAELERRHGRELALAIHSEGGNALEWIEDFIKSERIDCDWSGVGRFHAAHKSSAYERMARDFELQPKGRHLPAYIVPRSELRSEVGTDRYYGGVVYPTHASLHPGKYHLGLLALAQAAGVQIVAHCKVLGMDSCEKGHLLTTARGSVSTRDVLVASNGYTGSITPDLRRRLILIGSHLIATEKLDLAVTSSLIPQNRVLSDTRKVVFYYRLSPDRRRVVFGGRVLLRDGRPYRSSVKLRAELVRLFPELGEVRIAHAWGGLVAYTFDALPHLGRMKSGAYYCMGYCGSGISLASYFGTRIGQQIAGLKEGRTPLNEIPFQMRPLYTGNPWFLSASIAWYRFKDALPF